jgi:hypothetical protein
MWLQNINLKSWGSWQNHLWDLSGGLKSIPIPINPNQENMLLAYTFSYIKNNIIN